MGSSNSGCARALLGLRALAAVTALAMAGSARGLEACPYSCGDVNGDNAIDLADFVAFVDCMGQSPDASPGCLCADMDGSGSIDLDDFALFQVLFGQASDETPPDCTGALAFAANLTAYRPQNGAGYAPFVRTAVDEADEESPTLGPGIRVNAPGDADPAGEDDLIEITLHVDRPGAAAALRRSDAALRVWTTRDKQAGTEVPFVGDRTDALPLGPSQTDLTIWVEWASPAQGTASLTVEPLTANVPKDTLVFHTFQSIVIALGGESQVPTDPADPNDGTFAVAIDLYRQGYDVHMYDEDDVAADGTGATFNDVADAIQHRGVNQVALFGYSHGGGSVYSLADLLDLSRAGLGDFEISFASYVDAVRNNSDIDVAQELRYPPSAAYLLNQYQHGSFFEDFGLDGGPVTGANPPPTGLDVETTAWGANATHFEIDDFVEVRDLIKASLAPLVPRFALQATPALSKCARVAAAAAQTVFGGPLILLVAPGNAVNAAVLPDPSWQAAIDGVVQASSPAEQKAALDQVRTLDDGMHGQLIRQAVYYSSHAGDTPGAMVAGVIFRELSIPDDALVSALVPLLGTADAPLAKSVRSILGGCEGRRPGRTPDFSAYRDLIARSVRTGETPSDDLIRYMYASDAGEALLTLMRAYQLRQPEELRTILWAEHMVSDTLWKQQNGFLDKAHIESAAATELARLVRHPAWWVRLYVAEVMRQHPALSQRALIDQLARDTNSLVREVALTARGKQ